MEYYVSLFTETCKSRIVQYLLSCFSSLHTCFSAQSTRLKLLYSICRDEEQNHNDLGRAVPKKSKSTARLGVLSRPPLPPVPRCSRWSLPSPPASAAAHARPLRSGPKARLLFYLFGFWDLASGLNSGAGPHGDLMARGDWGGGVSWGGHGSWLGRG